MGLFGFVKKEQKESVCSAVIVAAGASTRMGSDKILAALQGEPVIVHTLRAFERAPSIGEIILVTREERLVELAQICKDYGISKVSKVVRGGASRTASVYLGAIEVRREAQLIAIHDGARPLVSVQMIERTVAQAGKCGAAAPALPVKDTIKVARDGAVESTPDRETLFAVQTPQVFEASLIKAALKKALDGDELLTDDCSAVERLGMKVVLVEGDEYNIKLTAPADLIIAECLMNGGMEYENRTRI